MNKANLLEKIEKYFIYIFILFFFIICSNLIKDFGVTLDDEIYYVNGLNSYIYVKNLFLNLLNKNIDINVYQDQLKEWPIIFELLLAFISDISGIENIDRIYLLSHQINFSIFCLSLIFFYELIQKRYNNFYLSLISIFLIILSPRIFGESFYNSRDIFLCHCLFF